MFATTRAWEVEEGVASDDPLFGVGGLGKDEERGMEGGRDGGGETTSRGWRMRCSRRTSDEWKEDEMAEEEKRHQHNNQHYKQEMEEEEEER